MTSSIPTLSSVILDEGNGSFSVRYDLDGPIPRTDAFLIGINASSQDGKVTRQFGIKFLDGQPIGFFVFDHNAEKQQNFEYVQAIEDEKVIITPYEIASYSQLGDHPILRAYVNYAGADLATEIPVKVI